MLHSPVGRDRGASRSYAFRRLLAPRSGAAARKLQRRPSRRACGYYRSRKGRVSPDCASPESPPRKVPRAKAPIERRFTLRQAASCLSLGDCRSQPSSCDFSRRRAILRSIEASLIADACVAISNQRSLRLRFARCIFVQRVIIT